ncbi:MAG TPA: hypothetical protein VGU65_08915 [Frateuria sp.]|uniref:hypothetical protein n=1 Tax=Frateuria sp. TaxID=2211372 RepID=UPI002DF0F1BA|nr:hypothetical protein [Frateuria sp.]
MNAPRAVRTSDAGRIARLSGELQYPVDATAMAARLGGLIGDPRHCVRVIDGEGRLADWIAAERRLGLVVDGANRRDSVGHWSLPPRPGQGAGLGVGVVRSNVQRQAAHPFSERLGYVRQKSQHVYARRLG